NYADSPGVRGPHGEMNCLYSRHFPQVCTQLLIFLVIRPLAGKIEIVFGENRRESVWVVGFQLASAGEMKMQTIGGGRGGFFVLQADCAKRKNRLKHAVRMNTLGGINGPGFAPDNTYAIRAGAKRPDCECGAPVMSNLMGAQKAKGIGILGAHEAADPFRLLGP